MKEQQPEKGGGGVQRREAERGSQPWLNQLSFLLLTVIIFLLFNQSLLVLRGCSNEWHRGAIIDTSPAFSHVDRSWNIISDNFSASGPLYCGSLFAVAARELSVFCVSFKVLGSDGFSELTNLKIWSGRWWNTSLGLAARYDDIPVLLHVGILLKTALLFMTATVYEKDNVRMKHAAPLLLLLMTVARHEAVFEHHKSLNFKICQFKTLKNFFFPFRDL